MVPLFSIRPGPHAGIGSVRVLETQTQSWGYQTTFQAVATANEGYTFSHFEYKYSYYAPGKATSGKVERSSNPLNGTMGDFSEVSFSEFRDSRGYSHYVEEVVAVFAVPKFKVRIVSSPDVGGTVNIESTVSVQTEVEREFDYGKRISLHAEANNGYELMRLENEAEEISIFPATCFGKKIHHMLNVYRDSNWTAVFRKCNGKIVFGQGGEIMCGGNQCPILDG